jgi:hypothetical protein
MTIARSLLLTTALALPLPAAADLTPEGLWQDWQDRAADAGRDLTAEVEQGAALTLRGLTLSRPVGDGLLTARFERMDLAQDGPGVRLTLPGGQQVTLTATTETEGTNVATFRLGDGALTAMATGDAAAPDYALSAPALSATLVSLVQDGTEVDADMRADLTGLAGTLSGLSGGSAPLVADLTADALATEVSVRDPATGSEVRNTASQQDVALRADLSGASGGWSLVGRLESRDGSSVSLQQGPDGMLETDSRQDTSRIALTLTDLRADYSAALTGFATTVTSSMMPMGPVSLAMAAADLTLSVPTAPTAELQTARIALDLTDATADEAVWKMFDPNGAFPRDPAQLRLVAEADIDMVAPNPALAGPDAEPAAAPRALRIDTFSLDLAGASLSGEGAFRFPEGPGGVPDLAQPVGEASLRASGLSGLMQQAMTGGIMSAEQMMGAQMMLGMFAVQGEGDSFTSRIEAREGGALFVNGNQLR